MNFAEALKAEIARTDGMTVAAWMERSNAHYYAAKDPLGAAGDFTTAPEISQMFGELIGAWAADLWQRAGSPMSVKFLELGPGRGTLMADALRAAKRLPGFGDAADVSFVETSPVLRAAQRAAVPDARHVTLGEDWGDAPKIVIANEFFDALPIRQFVGEDERKVVIADDAFCFSPEGEVTREENPAAVGVMTRIAREIARCGGAALIVDYGYGGGESGDTLQAVRRHEKVDPLAYPGDSDLTAHVDFAALRAAAESACARVHGPVSQAAFLSALGLGMRAEALMTQAAARGDDAARDAIAGAVHRLTAPTEMGALFKAMALTHPDWPQPAGV